jgi:hypothetical protein
MDAHVELAGHGIQCFLQLQVADDAPGADHVGDDVDPEREVVGFSSVKLYPLSKLVAPALE